MTESKSDRPRGLSETPAAWPDEKPAAGARETINLRATAAQKSLIDRAAAIKDKTRTEFMLDAATMAAENTILDQNLVLLDPEAYAAFVKMLDEPAEPSPELIRLMNTPAPWEK